jgi:protease-4
MSDSENSAEQSRPRGRDSEQAILDRLVFAALKEQTRARRWSVFFRLFFVLYLVFVTAALMIGKDEVEIADGEKHTAVVKVSGVISSGKAAGSENVIPGLKAAFAHEDTAVVVLDINSPGGSPVQSAYIFDEIMRLKQEHEEIPVYAVISDIAASGGYFVAAAADRIYVNKSSLVGSIGVRLDGFGFVETMNKLGIERRLLTAGENKALLDPFLPENLEQKAHLQTTLNQVHEHFIAAVKQGRGDRLPSTPEIFSGLIWSGEQSLQLGLADDYGTIDSVARELEAERVVDFSPKSSPLEWIFDLIGNAAGKQIGEALRFDYSLH